MTLGRVLGSYSSASHNRLAHHKDANSSCPGRPAASLRGYGACRNPQKEPHEPEHMSYMAVAEHLVLAYCMTEELCAAESA